MFLLHGFEASSPPSLPEYHSLFLVRFLHTSTCIFPCISSRLSNTSTLPVILIYVIQFMHMSLFLFIHIHYQISRCLNDPSVYVQYFPIYLKNLFMSICILIITGQLFIIMNHSFFIFSPLHLFIHYFYPFLSYPYTFPHLFLNVIPFPPRGVNLPNPFISYCGQIW